MAKKKGTRKRTKSSGKKKTSKKKPEKEAEIEEVVEEPEEKEPEVGDAVSEVLGKDDKKKKDIPKKYGKLILKWTADGYDVKELEELMETAGIKKIRAAFKKFEDAVSRIGEIRAELDKVDPAGIEIDVENMEELLSNPDNYEEASAQFEILIKKKRAVGLKAKLSKMVLPKYKDKVDKLKARLADLDDLDALEKDLDALKIEYKESYFVEGIVSDVKPPPKPAAASEPAPVVRAKAPMVVKDIFLLYKDGRFISHHTSRPVTKEEQKTLFADLKTGRNYLRSPNYLPHKLNAIASDGRNIVIQSGAFSVVIMITEGEVNPWTERIISKVLNLMEKEDAAALRDWNGDVATLKSSGKYMQALLFACMKLAKKGDKA